MLEKLKNKIEIFLIKKIARKMLKQNDYDCVRYINKRGGTNGIYNTTKKT